MYLIVLYPVFSHWFGICDDFVRGYFFVDVECFGELQDQNAHFVLRPFVEIECVACRFHFSCPTSRDDILGERFESAFDKNQW